MKKIKRKPMSLNEAWQCKRIKSAQYRAYAKWAYINLPSIDVPKGELVLYLEFGFSNRGADIDNPVKPFVDILQAKYGFNDNRIYRLVVDKVIVKAGDEYISFKIGRAYEG